MIRALVGEEPSAGSIARHYRGLLTGIFVEEGDEASAREAGCPVRGGRTVMGDREGSLRVARELLDFAEALA
jgi:hypothetical protein